MILHAADNACEKKKVVGLVAGLHTVPFWMSHAATARMGELGGRRISDMTGKYCRLELNIVERIDPACYDYGLMNFV